MKEPFPDAGRRTPDAQNRSTTTKLERPDTASTQAAAPRVERLVNTVIERALKARASDIHLEPREEGLRVRFRIDGLLREIDTFPQEIMGLVVASIKATADFDISEKRMPQDGRKTVLVGNRSIDLRISTIPIIHGEKVVIRLLPQDQGIADLEELGLHAQAKTDYMSFIEHAQGLILITGPTGSGKTSTLYATLMCKANPTINIVTIEDPIEYRLQGINQMQVNPKAKLTFASGLRSILRQDPDVIMVGEVRDEETASIVFQSALTGHLVFSTLHTNDTVSAVTRLVDLNVEPYLIASATIGIVAQRLVRTICSNCQEKYVPDTAGRRLIQQEAGRDVDHLVRGQGCKTCFQSGYLGREAVFEVLKIDEDIRTMIHDRVTEREIKEVAFKKGFRTLPQAGVEKVLQHKTTIEELLRVIRM